MPPATLCKGHPLILSVIIHNSRHFGVRTHQHGDVHRPQAWDANALLASHRLLFLKAWEPSSLMLLVT